MHPLWMNYAVGILFSLLIVGAPVVVSIMYAVVGIGGSWTTCVRRRYEQPDWRHPHDEAPREAHAPV